MPIDGLTPLPVIFTEIITRGLVSSAGSTTKYSEQVYQFRRTSTTNPFNKANVDTAFQAAIVVPLYAALNARVTQQFNTVRVLNDAYDAPTPFNHAVAGSRTGDSIALTVSAYIQLSSGLRGRSFRGSKKIFPMSESDTTSGTDDIFNAGCLTRLGTYANAILAGFTDSDGNVWVPVVVSRKLSQLTINNVLICWNDITGVKVRSTSGVMRRRKVASVY
jgi:hypothetical protein